MIELSTVGIRFSRIERRERTLNQTVRRGLSHVRRLFAATPSADANGDSPLRNGFWALREISLRIRRGESVAIVGKNGAGKSTLLQVIAGIYRPTVGRADVRGLVTALLGLNSGFNFELTGNDNIRLSGLLLGLSNGQIDELAPEIIRFSELEDFIDQPVRTYSSGMVARLGFAISTAVAPDVLLLDEVMGVGDGAFRERSTAKLFELIQHAGVVCLCSHNLAYVRQHCQRAVWLERGKLIMDGPRDTVIEAYERFLDGRSRNVPVNAMAQSA